MSRDISSLFWGGVDAVEDFLGALLVPNESEKALMDLFKTNPGTTHVEIIGYNPIAIAFDEAIERSIRSSNPSKTVWSHYLGACRIYYKTENKGVEASSKLK